MSSSAAEYFAPQHAAWNRPAQPATDEKFPAIPASLDVFAPSRSTPRNPPVAPHPRRAIPEIGKAPTIPAFPQAVPSAPCATIPTLAAVAPDRPVKPPAPSLVRMAPVAGSSENDRCVHSAQSGRSTPETGFRPGTSAGAAKFAKTLPAQGPRSMPDPRSASYKSCKAARGSARTTPLAFLPCHHAPAASILRQLPSAFSDRFLSTLRLALHTRILPNPKKVTSPTSEVKGSGFWNAVVLPARRRRATAFGPTKSSRRPAYRRGLSTKQRDCFSLVKLDRHAFA